MSNVKSAPNKNDGSAVWRCQVCEQELEYQQPIDLGDMLRLLHPFLEKHDHPELKPKPPRMEWERWIKCVDQMPHSDRTVKVCDEHGLETYGTYHRDINQWKFGQKNALGKIVEWRELASK